MPSVTLTYAELAARIGRTEIAAKSLAKRKRWKRSTGNDGLARITLDESEIADMSNPDRRGVGRPPANATWQKPIEPRSNPVHELQAKLAVAQALIAERDRELGSIRDRLGVAETRVAEIEIKLAVAETEITALQTQGVELRSDRDAWRSQAERLAVPAPVERRSWLRRLVG